MTLIIETGSGTNPAANSYATVQQLRNYASARGTDLSASTDADLEVLMIKAMDYLEGLRGRYKGVVAHPEIPQPLQWPRALVQGVDHPYWEFPLDEIPTQLVNAQLVLALEARTNDLLPNRLPSDLGPVTSKKVGPLSVSYGVPTQPITTPDFAKADALLSTLLKGSGNSIPVARC